MRMTSILNVVHVINCRLLFCCCFTSDRAAVESQEVHLFDHVIKSLMRMPKKPVAWEKNIDAARVGCADYERDKIRDPRLG